VAGFFVFRPFSWPLAFLDRASSVVVHSLASSPAADKQHGFKLFKVLPCDVLYRNTESACESDIVTPLTAGDVYDLCR
jgi:hypothetical protein